MVWWMSPGCHRPWPSRTCLPLLSGGGGVGLGREEKWQIVKKYACGESSKTVRLSDVLLDSGKFVFSSFSVFSKFSIMNMYFLNQKNKKLLKIGGDHFYKCGFRFFSCFSHLIKEIIKVIELGYVFLPNQC